MIFLFLKKIVLVRYLSGEPSELRTLGAVTPHQFSRTLIKD